MFQEILSMGILPGEGAEAFERVLSSRDRNWVTVSSMDLNVLIEHMRRSQSANQDSGGARFSRPELENNYVAPRNEVEKTLVEVWQTLFGISQVGVNDDFFELGGHSLLGIQLVSLVSEDFAVEMHLHTIFECPTVAEMASTIVDLQAAEIDDGG